MKKNKTIKPLTVYDGGFAYLIMIAIYLLLSLVVPLVLSLLVSENSFGYTAILATFSIISMLLVILYFVKKKGSSISAIINFSSFNGVWLVVSIMIAVGMFLGLGFVNLSINSFFEKHSIIISSASIKMDGGVEFFITCIAFAFLPALVEEGFFRGLILKALNGVKSGVVIVTVGLSFALYHCSLVQFLYQFIYGMLLTIVTLKAKSSIPAMASHFINNFTIILFEYLSVSLDMFNPLLILIGITILAVGVLLLTLYKKTENIIAQTTQSAKYYYIPCGVFAMVICFFLSIGVLLV